MKGKILVTGSAGMMPSHAVDYLVEHYGRDYDIYGVDDFSGGYKENVNKRSKFTKLDLRNRDNIEKYFYKNFKSGIDILICYAAAAQEIRSYFSPLYNASINDDCAKNAIVNAIRWGAKHIVYFSSMSRYGDGCVIGGDGNVIAQQPVPFRESYIPAPGDPYAASKVYIENFIKALNKVHKFTWTIWCPHNAFSPRQYVDPYRNFLAIWMNLILMKKDCFVYGTGDQMRAISWVNDYNPITCESLFNPNTYGQLINIGGDEHLRIIDWYNLVCEVTGWGRPAIRIAGRPGEVHWAYTAHDKAKALTGFENKTSARDALAEMWDYFKRKGPRPFKYLDKFEIDSPLIPETWRRRLI